MSNIITFSEIVEMFKKEFGPIVECFSIIQIPTNQTARCSTCSVFQCNGIWKEKNVSSTIENDLIAKPGVYILYEKSNTDDKVDIIKVGWHLENARKRAFQHLNISYADYDTKKLKENKNGKILLFTVQKEDHIHWVAALEIFFEKRLTQQ